MAWTSLFHAVFIRKKIKPIYKEKDGRYYKRVNGELSYWELQTCVKKYFADENNPIRKNTDFFIPLRNKIEHKFMPELDINIFGECESLLLNFDKILEKEFGEKYRLRETLSFALQLFPTSKAISKSVEISKDSEAVMKYIKNYRNTISPTYWKVETIHLKPSWCKWQIMIVMKPFQYSFMLMINFPLKKKKSRKESQH